MNIASIDIGSNTVLLLIASVDKHNFIKTIKNLYYAPRLGKGINIDGNIKHVSLSAFYSVLEIYKKEIEEKNCDVIIAKATAAFRNAKNSSSIIEDVKRLFNISIEIITGDTEAYLSFLGASSLLPDSEEKIVIDIGGGSTEIIYGVNKELKFIESFKIGAVSLTDEFIKKEISTDDEINSIREYCRSTFKSLPSFLSQSLSCIAVAGTPTTLSCIKQNLREYDEILVEGSLLTINELEVMVSQLKNLTPQQRLAKYGSVVAGREDVILAGSIILQELATHLKLDKYYVSGKGIRYGAVIDYLNKRHKR